MSRFFPAVTLDLDEREPSGSCGAVQAGPVGVPLLPVLLRWMKPSFLRGSLRACDVQSFVSQCECGGHQLRV